MYVAVMAFFARVSDPAVGGTYMTLLNTLSNLGGNWPSTLALWMVDSLTYKQCSAPNLQNNTCVTAKEVEVICRDRRLYGSVAAGSVPLGCGAVWLGEYFLTFETFIVPFITGPSIFRATWP